MTWVHLCTERAGLGCPFTSVHKLDALEEHHLGDILGSFEQGGEWMGALGNLFFNGGWCGDSLPEWCKLNLACPASMTELATFAAFVGVLVAAFVGGMVLGPTVKAPLLSLGAGLFSHEDGHFYGSSRTWGKRVWLWGSGWVGVCRGEHGKTLVPDFIIGVGLLEALLALSDLPFYHEDFPHEFVGLAHGTAV